MTSVSSERHTVQNPFLRYAREAGWTHLPPNGALRLRRGDSSPLLWNVFIQKGQALNPGVVDALKAEEVGKRLAGVRPTIEGNLQAWEYLRGRKTVFVEAELDYANPTVDAFHVTDEFRFASGSRAIRADVVFFINGIPIPIVETKAATRVERIGEMDQAEREQAERGISGEAFAVFWISKEKGIGAEPAERAARKISRVFTDLLHWQTSEAQSRQLRRSLRYCGESGCP
ncbi:MAG: type I restriction endonuclease [Candidatus Oleimicrobiaceae bacterium]